MLEVLQFIFRDFWTWLGTVLLIGAFSMPIGALFHDRFSIKVYKPPDKDKKEGE